MKHFPSNLFSTGASQLKTIRLHGVLREKFGESVKLSVDSPREAIRALLIIIPGFEQEFRKHSYRIIIGDPQTGLAIDESNLEFFIGSGKELHIIPDVDGSKEGVGKLLAGIALIGLTLMAPHIGLGAIAGMTIGSGAAAVTVGALSIQMGIGLALGGLATMLSPSPELPDYSDREENVSYLFSQVTNSTEEGGPVPVALGGPVMCGSRVISSGIDVEDIDLSYEQYSRDLYTENGFIGNAVRDIQDDLYGNPPFGDKGGKGSGASASTAEAPNTAASEAVARVLDLISAGEIEGWVDPEHPFRNIYLDETVVENQDGSENFAGLQVTLRNGTLNQDYIPGFPQAESPVAAAPRQLLYNQPATIGLSSDPVSGLAINRVRVILRFPALGERNEKTGELTGSSVRYRIGIVPDGGSVEWVVDNTINEKFTSTYQKAHSIALPPDGHPYQIRIERMTPDSESLVVQNDTFLDAIIEIIDGKLAYPGSAVAGVTAYARQFGERIPTRGYLIKGAICEVPSNYDPLSRTYTGQWNGTLKRAWTNNPAWILYTALTNEEWGLGNRIPRSLVDKWSLYEIGVYCDEQVPDGYGGTEPRYSFNMWISRREHVYKAMQTIASSFRGMLMWGRGAIVASQDAPQEPKRVITNANVYDGRFVYEGTGRKAIHTVALVTWVNPADGWKSNVEVVENPELIAKYGWRPLDLFAPGTTSRGQARRMGLWALYTEQMESEIVTFKGSFELADIIPGNVIQIADANQIGIRMGGRVVSATSNSVTMDAPFEFEAGGEYKIYLTLPDGVIIERTLNNGAGTTSVATFSSPLPTLPLADLDSVFALSSNQIGRQLFRVLHMAEHADNEIEIVATQHYPQKYAFVEENIPFDPDAGSVYDSRLLPAPPTNIKAERVIVNTPSGTKDQIELSFNRSVSELVTSYDVKWRYAYGVWTEASTTNTSLRLDFAGPGQYDFLINSRNAQGKIGKPASYSKTFGDERPIDPTNTINLRIAGQEVEVDEFTGRVLKIEWDIVVPDGYEDDPNSWEDPYFLDYEVRLETVSGVPLKSYYTKSRYFEISAELYEEIAVSFTRTIRVSVRSRDKHGTVTPYTTRIFTNPPPALTEVDFINASNVSFQVAYREPTDPDFEGMMLWVSKTPGFTMNSTTLKHRGKGNATVRSLPEETFYIRYGFYDAFGEDGMIISAEFPYTTSKAEIMGLDADEWMEELEEIINEGTNLGQDISDLADAILAEISTTQYQKTLNEARTLLDGIPIGSVVRNEIVRTDTAIETLDMLAVRTEDGTGVILRTDTILFSEDETFLEHLDQMVLDLENGYTAAISDLATIVANENSITAEKLSILGAFDLNDGTMVLDTDKVYTAPGETIGSRLSSIVSQIGTEISVARDEIETWVDTESQGAKSLSYLGTFNNADGTFSLNQTKVLWEDDQTLGDYIESVRSQIGSDIASYDSSIKTWVNSSSAGAQYISTLNSSFGGDFIGSVTQLSSTVSGQGSRWALTVSSMQDGRLALAGIQLVAGTNSQSGVIIFANSFGLVDPNGGNPIIPFSYSGGIVYMDYIVARQIDANTVTADKVVANNITETSRTFNNSGVTVGDSYVEIGQHVFISSNGFVDISVWTNISTNDSIGVAYYCTCEYGSGGGVIYQSRFWGHYIFGGNLGAYNSTTFIDRFQPGAGFWRIRVYARRGGGGGTLVKDACTITTEDHKTQY